MMDDLVKKNLWRYPILNMGWKNLVDEEIVRTG